MIVRDKPSGLQLFFLWRGSVVGRIVPQLSVTVLLAVLVTLTHGFLFRFKITLTPIPFSLMGLALAIFLGFRNSASYERFVEGRRLWGDLLIACRSLVRQSDAFLGPARGPDVQAARRRFAHRLAAFAYALRNRLRELDPVAELAPLLAPAELEVARRSGHVPNALLLEASRQIEAWRRAGLVGELAALRMDDGVGRLTAVVAGCERLRGTPIPFSYTVLLHRTVYLYCFLLPFGLIDSVGAMTPLVVGLVAYTFFGLDAIGDEIEEPFGRMPNDLPLDALSRALEIELRQGLGETALPEPVRPVDYNLC